MNISTPLLRSVGRSVRASEPWICHSCALPARIAPRHRSNILPPTRRSLKNTPESRSSATSPMEDAQAAFKTRNRTTVYYVLSTILGTVALSYGSVPFYKMICQTTGWGGQPIKSAAHTSSSTDDPSERLKPLADAKRLRITFNGSVSDVMPWKFTPQQREVRVVPGETALAFYTATNLSDEDIIGVATYSVVPGQVAPYFSKIQCFCFEEQRLNAGETVDMPVFFYIDPEFAEDLNMRKIETITLSYTFFSKHKFSVNTSASCELQAQPEERLIDSQRHVTINKVI
ncbi:uncharacterized protein BDZ99DRAFT_571633 [Mytilinidion resinicola]|uniref:Uncharacterized protein n=1 Tax=Mytilinidion resinicola TaxID=574789 RepID=A0A6A6YJK9_9PEZI|nr:uncharacterized protein BDZ99DRAFT_571633 [Mytilinidion resinicola]KAF2808738.1 hypothetical protein BDZ99DRAFT_571633 [Mytilinidion resinicola]